MPRARTETQLTFCPSNILPSLSDLYNIFVTQENFHELEFYLVFIFAYDVIVHWKTSIVLCLYWIQWHDNLFSDGLWNRSKRVRTPVALLCSLASKYPWERYEPPYPPSYGLNSTTTGRMAFTWNNLQKLICH